MCRSAPVFISHTIRFVSQDPDITMLLSNNATATHVTASVCPTNTYILIKIKNCSKKGYQKIPGIISRRLTAKL